MGREVVRAISGEEGVRLVGAVDVSSEGQDAGLVAGIGEIGIPIHWILLRFLLQPLLT
jgi:dihydrodipicolinate reductase